MHFYPVSCPMTCLFCNKNLPHYACTDCNIFYYQHKYNIYYKKFFLIIDSTNNNKLFIETKTNDPYMYTYQLITDNFNIKNLNLKQIHQKIDNMAVLL